MIPEAVHGPYGDVFDRFAETAAGNGHIVVRFETWKEQADVAEKTESEYEADIDASVEFLQSRGCTTTIIAKSFGGRLALTHVPDAADRIVLWAPAILFGDHDDAPSITASELAEIAVPVRILQGDGDEEVLVESAPALAEHLPNGEWIELSGEDHSFLNDQQRIIEETIALLPK